LRVWGREPSVKLGTASPPGTWETSNASSSGAG